MRINRLRLFEFLCNGFFFGFHLLGIYFVMPNIQWMMKVYLALYRRVNEFLLNISISQKLNKLRRLKNELLKTEETGYKRTIDELGLTEESLARLKEAHQSSFEVVIADIDRDGFYHSYFGPIEDILTISKDKFLKRKKFSLQVVAINGYLGVKKSFQDNRIAFFHEIEALHLLGKAGCNIPAILDVDFENLTLTISLILGSVLREKLAGNGAVLRDCDVDNHPEFSNLTPYDSAIKRIKEAKHILFDVVDTHFVEGLFAELKKIHSAGFLLDDIKYGNIVIEKESGQPYFIDFDCARNYSRLNKNVFIIYRDLDVEKFNLHFGTEKLTYHKVKEKIKSEVIDSTLTSNMPVYLGAGIRIGPVRKIDSGYGNWKCFLRNYLPPFYGKRVLVVLPNNAFYSLQMLREGARKVVGLDTETRNDDNESFIHEAYEWADNKTYDYQNIKWNINNKLKMELGQFDFILTQYSLNDQNDDLFAIVVQAARKISNLLVVIFNNNVYKNRSCKFQKFPDKPIVDILKTNGFSIVQKSIPLFCGYSPIIARKTAAGTISLPSHRVDNPHNFIIRGLYK